MGKCSPYRRKHNPAPAQHGSHCPVNPPKALHPLLFSEVPLLLILKKPPKSRVSKEVSLIKISLAACTQTQSTFSSVTVGGMRQAITPARITGYRERGGNIMTKTKKVQISSKKVQPPFPCAQLQQGERLNVDRMGICEWFLSFLGGILNSRNMFPLETFPTIWSNFLLQELNQLMM